MFEWIWKKWRSSFISWCRNVFVFKKYKKSLLRLIEFSWFLFNFDWIKYCRDSFQLQIENVETFKVLISAVFATISSYFMYNLWDIFCAQALRGLFMVGTNIWPDVNIWPILYMRYIQYRSLFIHNINQEGYGVLIVNSEI